jgi:hypothetical protein
MGIMQWIGLGKEISEPIKAVGDLYTTDKARIEAQKDFEEIAQKPHLAQLETNKLLASSSWFNSSWQPLLGWTCGFLVLLYYAPQIVVITWVWGKACALSGIVKPFPMRADDILNLVWLLFGFGGYSLAKSKL